MDESVVFDSFERLINELPKGDLFQGISDSFSIYKSLVSILPDALVLHIDGQIRYVNSKALEYLGAEDAGELIGKPVMEFVHPDYRKAVAKRIKLMATTGEVAEPMEEKLIRVDGTVFDAEITGIPVQFGDKVGIQVIVKDIEKEKQAERTYKEIFNNSRDLIYIQEKSGIFIDVNKSVLDKYGFTKEEIIGESPAIFAAPGLNDMEAVKEATIQCWKGEPQKLDWWSQKKNGEIFPKELILARGQYFGKDVVIATGRDITERLQAETALKDREAIFRSLFQNSPLGIVMSDPNGKLLQANTALCEMLGYTEKEITSRTIQDFTFADDEKREAALMRKIYSGKHDSYQLEKRFRSRDNKILWCHMSISVVRDEDTGDIKHLISTVEDITGRKQSENALKENIHKFRSLFENNPIGIVACSRSFKVRNANQFFRAYVGYRRNMLPKKLFDIIHEEDHDLVKELVSHIKGNRNAVSSSKEIRVVADNGLTKFASMSVSAMYNDSGQVEEYLFGVVDITERLKMERALKDQQQMVQVISQNIMDSIVRTTQIGEIIYSNDAFLKLFGYSKNEIKDISAYDLYFRPEDRQRLLYELSEHGQIDKMHLLLKRKDGSSFWALVSSRLSESADGAFNIDTAITDITEIKDARLKLEEQNQELSKLNSELDHLVYRTSHDLRAPIASLLGLVNLSTMDYDETQTLENLDLMKTQLHKLDHIIREIIEYRRVAKSEVKTNKIDFKKIIEDIYSDFRFIESFEGIERELELDARTDFYNDEHNIRIILNNLLSNAVKYQDTTKESRKINVQVRVDSASAKILVSDNGIGIADDMQEKVFDMFFRATTQSTGTGLGLFIVKESLDKVGGQVRLKSKEGSGSKFELIIPNAGKPEDQ